MQSDANEPLAGDVQMLRDTPENDADIQTLADNSYISKYHYIRRFRAVSGLTPNRFRLQSFTPWHQAS